METLTSSETQGLFASDYLGEYLDKEDFPTAEPVTISQVEQRQLGENERPRLVVMFREFPTKAMVLNRTNTQLLADVLGDDCSLWVGQRVVVYNDTTVTFAGKRVGGLRLRAAGPNDGHPQRNGGHPARA